MTKTQRWKRLRELGLTAADVAAERGCHRTTVARVLNGASFRFEIADAIAGHFGLPVTAVFPKAPVRALRKAAA